MKIALIGKTNVGKSTLFNLFLRKKNAIVSDINSTTVDFQEGDLDLFGHKVTMIDTGGYEGDNISVFMHSTKVFNKVDLLLFIVSLEGVTSDDIECLNYIRKKSLPIILVINKCEQNSFIDNDFYKLGITDIAYTSCKSNYGIDYLKDKINTVLNLDNIIKDNTREEEEKKDVIKLSIIGRPNAGKSTLLNTILCDDRVVVSEKAGTTRDSVSVDYEYKDMNFKITDTAGLRRKRGEDFLENISVKESFKAVDDSDICIVMLDSQNYMQVQDVKIIAHIAKSGKPPIILFNKWDLIQDKEKEEKLVRKMLEHNLTGINDVKYFFISAIRLKKNILLEVYRLYRALYRKISTSSLNKWLSGAVEYKKPPIINKKVLRIKYMTQTSCNPLKFLLFVSQYDVGQNYLRYLKNSLTKHFKISGVPVIIEIKKSDNPYAITN